VLNKLDDRAPHDCLLVLDATVGQNAHAQVETFQRLVAVTGLAVTKLDGTARGGVLVALAQKFGLPVIAIGVGEALDDLRPFEAKPFARALLGLEDYHLVTDRMDIISSLDSIHVEGLTRTITNGYPDATAISDTLGDTTGFTVTTNAGDTVTTFAKTGASGTCESTYTDAAANNPPAIAVDTSGC